MRCALVAAAARQPTRSSTGSFTRMARNLALLPRLLVHTDTLKRATPASVLLLRARATQRDAVILVCSAMPQALARILPANTRPPISSRTLRCRSYSGCSSMPKSFERRKEKTCLRRPNPRSVPQMLRRTSGATPSHTTLRGKCKCSNN